MNKKIIIIIVAIVVVFSIGIGIWAFSANKNAEDNNSNVNTENNEENNVQEDNKKIAIVYFSATGNTKRVAEFLKNSTKGELMEIIPKEIYTEEDLNYENNNSRANLEQTNAKSKPEIANTMDVLNYDVIYLGYPIWWGNVPKIILTFLDTYDLSGKTVIPFCTSGSSGISTSLNTLRNYNSNINWIEGKRFSLSTSESEINNWVDSLKDKIK